jgi:hypothetical protein
MLSVGFFSIPLPFFLHSIPQSFSLSFCFLFLPFPYSIFFSLIITSWPGSSVGITTGYGLDGPGIESQRVETFRTCPDRPWGPSILLYNG